MYTLMENIELIGFCAAILTSLSFLPQALLIIRTGVTAGISLVMYSMLTIGKACWLSYGLLVVSWPLICANLFTLTIAIFILSMTVKSRLSEKGLSNSAIQTV